MEQCPTCGRMVRSAQQWHYCQKIAIDDLFVNKPDALVGLHFAIADEVAKWEGVSMSATKNCVVFVRKQTFLVIKPMKSVLNLKFYLPYFTDEPPVHRCLEDGRRFDVQVRLADETGLSRTLFRWLKESYTLC